MSYTHYVLLRVTTEGRYTHETIGDCLPKDVFKDVKVLDSDDADLFYDDVHPYISF